MGLVRRLLRLGGDEGGPPYAYPLDRSSERSYPDGYEGDLYVWDIDKTYLSTEFDSLVGLLSVPLEFAVDKRNVAGTDVLLRALRRGPDPETVRSAPLYFVSASPPQLRTVIERKMVLDGVEYDGITFKDQLALVRSGKVGKLKEHVGYKLSALLLNRRELPWTVRETLFGDDSETDALIYGLYADIVAGRLRGEPLARTLRRNGVEPEDAGYVTGLADGLNKGRDLVHRIYINLEHRSAPGAFHAWGRRVVPCFDTFQMALHLLDAGKIGPQAAFDVGLDLVNRYARTPLSLVRSALDLVQRGELTVAALAALWPDLQERALVPPWVTLDPERAPTPAADPRQEGDFVTPARFLALA